LVFFRDLNLTTGASTQYYDESLLQGVEGLYTGAPPNVGWRQNSATTSTAIYTTPDDTPEFHTIAVHYLYEGALILDYGTGFAARYDIPEADRITAPAVGFWMRDYGTDSDGNTIRIDNIQMSEVIPEPSSMLMMLMGLLLLRSVAIRQSPNVQS